MYASSLKVQKMSFHLFVRRWCSCCWQHCCLFVHLYRFFIFASVLICTHTFRFLFSLLAHLWYLFFGICLCVCLFALQDTTFNNHGPQTPPSQIRPQGTQEPSSLQETPPLQAQGQEALSPPPQEEVLFRLSGNDIFMIICKPDFHPGDLFTRVAHPITRVLDHRFSSNW